MSILGLTCLRNEAPYLVDWLAHHLALGVDHFVICSHDCDDGSDRLLDALAQSGVLTHERFTPTAGKTVQWQALRRLDQHPRTKSCDWALFFDVDEYLNLPPQLGTVSDLINSLPDADAVAIGWRFFGSAGLEAYDARPVTERFTQAAPSDLHYPLAHLFKSLHRPSVFQKLGVHRPRNRKDQIARWKLGNGADLAGGIAENDKAITLYGQPGLTQGAVPVLNHYALRSAQEFLVKRDRGLPNHSDRKIDLNYWVERNWNTVPDDSISRFAAKTSVVREQVMSLPGVRAAHEAGVDWHRRQIDALLTDIETVRFVWRLGLQGGSTPPTAERAKGFIEAQLRAMVGND